MYNVHTPSDFCFFYFFVFNVKIAFFAYFLLCLFARACAQVKAAKLGHILVIDEADKAPTNVTSILKTLVESGEMILADGRRIISGTCSDHGTVQGSHATWKTWEIRDDYFFFIFIFFSFSTSVVSNFPGHFIIFLDYINKRRHRDAKGGSAVWQLPD